MLEPEDIEHVIDNELLSALKNYFWTSSKPWITGPKPDALDVLEEPISQFDLAQFLDAATSYALNELSPYYQEDYTEVLERCREWFDAVDRHTAIDASLGSAIRAFYGEAVDAGTHAGDTSRWIPARFHANPLLRSLGLLADGPRAGLQQHVYDPCAMVRAAVAVCADEEETFHILANDESPEVRIAAAKNLETSLEMPPIDIDTEDIDIEDGEASSMMLCRCALVENSSNDWGFWFREANLGVPELPAPLAAKVDIQDQNHSATQAYPDPMLDYMFGPVATYLQGPIPDQFSISHAGHGVNSYGITARGALGNIAFLIQTEGYGAYNDSDEVRTHWDEALSRVESITKFNTSEFSDEYRLRDAVLLYSSFREEPTLAIRLGSEWEFEHFESLGDAVQALMLIADPVRFGSAAMARDFSSDDPHFKTYMHYFGDEPTWARLIPHAWAFRNKQITAPPLPTSVPGDRGEAFAFFEAAYHLVSFGLGWQHPSLGFDTWHQAGRPVADPQMAAVVGWLREYLPGFVKWTFEFDGREAPQWLVDECNQAARILPTLSNIWSGGSDPLHLTSHADPINGDRGIYRAVGPKGALPAEIWITKYCNFAKVLNMRTWVDGEEQAIRVHIAGMGHIGDFRVDTTTGIHHCTTPEIHRWGNGNANLGR